MKTYTIEHKENEEGEEYTVLLNDKGNSVYQSWGHNTLAEMRKEYADVLRHRPGRGHLH